MGDWDAASNFGVPDILMVKDLRALIIDVAICFEWDNKTLPKMARMKACLLQYRFLGIYFYFDTSLLFSPVTYYLQYLHKD